MGSVIGFAGMSHLGIVSSIAVASKGFDVVSYDADRQLTAELSSRKLRIHEPELDDLLRDNASRMMFTSDAGQLGRCSVVVAAIDIPTNEKNESDLKAIDNLVDQLIEHLAVGSTLVILSQVRPGYTRALGRRIEKQLNQKKVQLYYQVETLVFGRAVERATKPERYMVGCADPAQPLPATFAELLSAFGCPILPMRYESAELAKISINMFLTASVCTSNVLAEVCEKIGADWQEIVPALRLDQRIGQYAYLAAGLGIAGGNLERDLTTVISLAGEGGSNAGVIESYVKDSKYRSDWALRTLAANLGKTAQTPVVAVWGLAYKQNTKSVKNSPSMALVETLKSFAIQAFDPQVVLEAGRLAHVSQKSTAMAACEQADALIIMTPWPEFSKVSLAEVAKKLKSPLVIDPFGCVSADECRRLGLQHHRIGVATLEAAA